MPWRHHRPAPLRKGPAPLCAHNTLRQAISRARFQVEHAETTVLILYKCNGCWTGAKGWKIAPGTRSCPGWGCGASSSAANYRGGLLNSRRAGELET